jgi:hypothetical protein
LPEHARHGCDRRGVSCANLVSTSPVPPEQSNGEKWGPRAASGQPEDPTALIEATRTCPRPPAHRVLRCASPAQEVWLQWRSGANAYRTVAVARARQAGRGLGVSAGILRSNRTPGVPRAKANGWARVTSGWRSSSLGVRGRWPPQRVNWNPAEGSKRRWRTCFAQLWVRPPAP